MNVLLVVVLSHATDFNFIYLLPLFFFSSLLSLFLLRQESTHIVKYAEYTWYTERVDTIYIYTIDENLL